MEWNLMIDSRRGSFFLCFFFLFLWTDEEPCFVLLFFSPVTNGFIVSERSKRKWKRIDPNRISKNWRDWNEISLQFRTCTVKWLSLRSISLLSRKPSR
jgi:hypothetical protein